MVMPPDLAGVRDLAADLLIAMTPLLLKRLPQFTYLRFMATWRSGDAAVCKTVYPGSIPGVASTIKSKTWTNF
jgi:hypothetical protein